MPLLQSDVAAGSQAWTNIQRNQLEQQYMPQRFAEEAVQHTQATEIQKLNLQKLTNAVKQEEVEVPLVKQVMSDTSIATSAEKARKLGELIGAKTGNRKAVEEFMKLSETFETTDTAQAVRKEQARALLVDRGLSILDSVDTKNPADIMRAVTEAQTAGLDTKGFLQRQAAGMPPAENLKITRHQLMGHKAAMEEEKRAIEAKNAETRRLAELAKEKNDAAAKARAEAREQAGAAKEARLDKAAQRAEDAEARKEQEVSQKKSVQAGNIRDTLNNKGRLAHKDYLLAIKDLDKEDIPKMKNAYDSYKNAIDSLNEAAREKWVEQGHAGPVPQSVIPPFETWTEDDRKAAAKPTSKTKYTATNPAKPQTAADLAKLEDGDVYINPSDGKPLIYHKKK